MNLDKELDLIAAIRKKIIVTVLDELEDAPDHMKPIVAALGSSGALAAFLSYPEIYQSSVKDAIISGLSDQAEEIYMGTLDA